MNQDLKLQLQGFRLTTVQILYRMPDHPALLQTFVWQQMDQAPQYPRLQKFLDFWRHNLDGELHSVNVSQAGDGQAKGDWAGSARDGQKSDRHWGIRHADHMATLH